MRSLTRIGMALAALTTASVVAFGGGAAVAAGGSGGGGGGDTWPTQYPLPTDPGTIVSQTSTTAVVRSTDDVSTVKAKLDALYVTGLGCVDEEGVDRPRDYFCVNPATGKTDEILFTFAALDPTPTDPSRSQSNAFLGGFH